jgi:putative transposase
MSRYPSDLSDAQWAILEPLVSKPERMGRPVKLDLREIVNALLYMDRTGCQWRQLPKDFPVWTSVRYYFDKWTHDGTLQRINDALCKAVRRTLEREPTPQIAVLDSQSVKTSEVGGERGVDGGKKGQRTQTSHPGGHQRVVVACSGVGSRHLG